MTCVYIARAEKIGVKVGISSDAVRRIKALRKEHSVPISLEYCQIGDGPAIGAIEKQAHALLYAHLVKGEWFSVSVEQAVAAVTKAAAQLGYTLTPWDGSLDVNDHYRCGRPRTDAKPVMVRLMPSDYEALKRWMGKQEISDPEAIRRLLRSHPELKRYLGDGK